MSARARVRREGDERLFMTLLGCTSKATDYEQKGRLGDMRRSSSSRRVSIVREIENVIYTAPRGRKVIYVAAVVVAAARPGGGGETLFFPSPSEASVLLHCVRIIFLTNITHVACSLVYAANVLKNIRRSFYTFLPAVVLTQQILS